MANKASLVPFKKNNPATGERDPRINRRGRIIRGLDALSKEWQAIWAEVMFDERGQPIIDEVTGKALTRIQARMRVATSSRNNQEFKVALEYAYGKVPQPVTGVGDDGAVLIQSWKDFIESRKDVDTESSSK